METYLLISYLNDFTFCPRSIYFHQCYGRMNQRLYQSNKQLLGKKAHARIDDKKYSTSSKVFQAIEIYSNKYRLGGKIDTYDQTRKQIVERKRKISRIYDGYIFQLYAQYHCLTEMGYQVDSLKLYSLQDNKSHFVKLPSEDIEKQQAFEALIKAIRSFSMDAPFTANPKKCKACVYRPICDQPAC